MGYSPWGCKELDMTEHAYMHFFPINLLFVDIKSLVIIIRHMHTIPNNFFFQPIGACFHFFLMTRFTFTFFKLLTSSQEPNQHAEQER